MGVEITHRKRAGGGVQRVEDSVTRTPSESHMALFKASGKGARKGGYPVKKSSGIEREAERFSTGREGLMLDVCIRVRRLAKPRRDIIGE